MAVLFSYSQRHCDKFGDYVNIRMVPDPDSVAFELAGAALAEIEACHCCNYPYTYRLTGTVASGEFRFDSGNDSLYIHDTTATGQNFSGIWNIIDNYTGSVIVLNYMVNPGIFGSFEIEHNTGMDHGTYWAYHVSVIKAPVPGFANNRAHCFTFSFGGLPGPYIPLAGTLVNEDVTGAIYFDGTGMNYIAPHPSGIEITCQIASDYSQYVIDDNLHRFRASDGTDQLEVKMTDSSYHVDFTDPMALGITYDVDYSANSPLTLVTKDYVDDAVSLGLFIPIDGTGSTPCSGPIELIPSMSGQGFLTASQNGIKLLGDNGSGYTTEVAAEGLRAYMTASGTTSGILELTQTKLEAVIDTNKVITKLQIIEADNGVTNTVSTISPTGYSLVASSATQGGAIGAVAGVAYLKVDDNPSTTSTSLVVGNNQVNVLANPNFAGINETTDYSATRCNFCYVTKNELDDAITGLVMPDIGALPPTATLTDVINHLNLLRTELQAAGLMSP